MDAIVNAQSIQLLELLIKMGALGFVLRSLWAIPVELKELNTKFSLMIQQVGDHESRLRAIERPKDTHRN